MHLPNQSKPSARGTHRRPSRSMDRAHLGVLPLQEEDEQEVAEADESDESGESYESNEAGESSEANESAESYDSGSY